MGKKGPLEAIHGHLGPIWYHSELSDVPYSPNQFLGWDFLCCFLQQLGSDILLIWLWLKLVWVIKFKAYFLENTLICKWINWEITIGIYKCTWLVLIKKSKAGRFWFQKSDLAFSEVNPKYTNRIMLPHKFMDKNPHSINSAPSNWKTGVILLFNLEFRLYLM